MAGPDMRHVQQPVDLAPGQHLGEFRRAAADMQRLAVVVFGEELLGRDGGEQVGEGQGHGPTRVAEAGPQGDGPSGPAHRRCHAAIQHGEGHADHRRGDEGGRQQRQEPALHHQGHGTEADQDAQPGLAAGMAGIGGQRQGDGDRSGTGGPRLRRSRGPGPPAAARRGNPADPGKAPAIGGCGAPASAAAEGALDLRCGPGMGVSRARPRFSNPELYRPQHITHGWIKCNSWWHTLTEIQPWSHFAGRCLTGRPGTSRRGRLPPPADPAKDAAGEGGIA